MKKIILTLLSIIIVIFLGVFIQKNSQRIESKYDNLESVYLDYGEMMFDKKGITSEVIKKDLAGFDLSKDSSSKTESLEYKGENEKLDIFLINNSIFTLRLDTNTNSLNKSIDTDGRDSINGYVTSNTIDTQSKILDTIDSTFGIDIIKNNKETIDAYNRYLQALKKEGNITLDKCRELLDLKLDSVDEVLDMTGTLRYGYFEVYYENNYTIKTFDDMVIDVSIKLEQCNSEVDYFIILGSNNDFIYSEENQIKIFVTKQNIDDILKSSYSNSTYIALSPNYKLSNELSKEEFNKLYNIFEACK